VYTIQSGLDAYFSSRYGTPDTNLMRRPMKRGEKTVAQPYSVEHAIK
jgi:hypothetical protein